MTQSEKQGATTLTKRKEKVWANMYLLAFYTFLQSYISDITITIEMVYSIFYDQLFSIGAGLSIIHCSFMFINGPYSFLKLKVSFFSGKGMTFFQTFWENQKLSSKKKITLGLCCWLVT